MTIEGVEFVELKPGYFRMGSHFLCQKGDLIGRICAPLGLPWGKRASHGSAFGQECPVRWLQVKDPFWLARSETTNEQFERFDPGHPRSLFSNAENGPVAEVAWSTAQDYCRWLGHRAGLHGRLPTEVEWEYACRAGELGEYCFGSDAHGLSEYALFGRPDVAASDVSAHRPNEWGFFDMHGNVEEWCEDRFGTTPDFRQRRGARNLSAADDPLGDFRTVRGGSWCDDPEWCRSAFRSGSSQSVESERIGIRPLILQ